jgi:para-nitrobenzyl esterase
MDSTVVRIETGLVKGVQEGDVLAWRGIPFAQTPRFRAPVPVAPWNGIRDASSFGPIPWQTKISPKIPNPIKPSRMSESLLCLNVVRPAREAQQLRPVLVYIYGGGNRVGFSDQFPGTTLAVRGDLVYVTFNYRLGVFGFVDFSSFSTADHPFDSNPGTRDQLAALQWVQRNIAMFGGDPENVTIWGESAGALAVTTLLGMPSARGLFQRAISQSSPANNAYHADTAAMWARRYLSILGLDQQSVGELHTLPPERLVAAGYRFSLATPDEQPGALSVSPVIGGDLLLQHPIAAIRDGNGNKVPLLIGTCANEGTTFAKIIPDLATSPARLDKMFAMNKPGAKERVVAAYPGYPAPGVAAQMGGDFSFWAPSIEIARAQAMYAPVWMYRFDLAPRLFRLLGLNATHGIDTFLPFAEPQVGTLQGILGGKQDIKAVAQRMQADWISFVQQGKPRPEWPQYSPPQRLTLIFGRTDRVESDPQAEKREAWEQYADYR